MIYFVVLYRIEWVTFTNQSTT